MTRYRFALIGLGMLLSVVAAATTAPSGSPFAWPEADSEPNLADLALSGDPIPAADAEAAWGGPDATARRPRSERVRGSFIVRLAEGLDPHEVGPQLAAQYGGEAAFIYDEVLGGFAFKGPDDARDDLARDPRVLDVDADQVVYPMSHRPELASMGATDAWNIAPTDPRYRGAGAVVAIIDSGLQVRNPNLGDGDTTIGEPGDSVLGLHNCTSGKVIDDSANHGTWVFGTAVGREGVLPEGKGYHIKIGKSTASESNMVCGLNKVKQWINEGKTIHAANLSWGCDGSCILSSVRRAITELRTMGVPVMVSAGNSGAAVEEPAKYQDSVAVSATDVTNTSLASFSSRGPEVDIAAPGDGISVLSSSGCCWLGRGTSFSAPHAAAAAALLKSLYPGLSVNDVVSTMQRKGFVRSGLVEPALNVGGVARGPDSLPTGSFVGLADGQEVAGTVTIRVQASDDHPLPAGAVAVKIGSGSFQPASLVGTSYERTWNTCPSSPCPADPTGPVRIEAKITDSIGQSTTIPLDVTVDNVDDPPKVSFVRPTSGAQTAQSFDVRVAATDDNGVSAVELFVDDVSKGTRTTPVSGSEYGWSLSDLPVGTRVLRARATDASNSSSASVTVAVRSLFYRQGFDGAAGDPNDLAGWTVSGDDPLWHVSSSCGAASSAPRGFYYGRDSSCNYDIGSSHGYLTSPTISGLPATYSLSFRSKEKVEPSCTGGSCSTRDVRSVEVNYGQGWVQVYRATAATDPGSGSWLTRSFALGSSSGTLKVRFLFDSDSGADNEFFGWAIDDIVVAP